MTKIKPLLSFCCGLDYSIDLFNDEPIERTGFDSQILHRCFERASDGLNRTAGCVFGDFLDDSVGRSGLMLSRAMRISVPMMFQHLVSARPSLSCSGSDCRK